MEEAIITNPIWVWLLAICGGIVTFATAITAIVNWVKALKKPNDDQNNRIKTLEDKVAAHDILFKSDGKRLELIESGNRVIQRSILALLEHGIDGNNIDAMRKAKDDLQEHLIER